MTQDYMNLMNEWCEEMLQTYHHSFSELRKQVAENELKEWEQQMLGLKTDLMEGTTLDQTDIHERASELYLRFDNANFTSQKEKDKNNLVRAQSGIVPIGEHTLPPLPYEYDALEPYISKEIMRLHHDKHHKGYVEGLNKAEKEMRQARLTNKYNLIKHWEREAAFHGAGHYLHTIFWNIMSPKGGGLPSGMLLRELNQSFGSFEKFKQHFTEAAINVEAVGWAILVWSPRSRRLEILQAEKHQNLSQWDVVPLLVLDVWEHAYYLQYKNERKKYVENWWNIVNWREVERRFYEAQKLKWQPF